MGGAFTGTGFLSGSGEGCCAIRLASINCNNDLQMSHPQSTQLLRRAGQEGFPHHCASVEVFWFDWSLATGVDCGEASADWSSDRGDPSELR